MVFAGRESDLEDCSSDKAEAHTLRLLRLLMGVIFPFACLGTDEVNALGCKELACTNGVDILLERKC